MGGREESRGAGSVRPRVLWVLLVGVALLCVVVVVVVSSKHFAPMSGRTRLALWRALAVCAQRRRPQPCPRQDPVPEFLNTESRLWRASSWWVYMWFDMHARWNGASSQHTCVRGRGRSSSHVSVCAFALYLMRCGYQR